MRTALAALLLMAGGSIATLATAQSVDKPAEMAAPAETPGAQTADARSYASDREVGEARRAYRNACKRHESHGFCECVTAGVAQALPPDNVRVAARTIGQRINSAAGAGDQASDATRPGADPMERIAQVEAHYANVCAQFRGA